MAEFPLPTHKTATVAIDEQACTALSSVQFLLEQHPRSPTTQDNDLKFMICGEEGFKAIAKDLREAKQSVDLVCWGFDPGMELEREKDAWPRGVRYGELLEEIAQKGVKVRLLIWYNTIGSLKQNNLIGKTDDHPILGFKSPYNDKARHKWCVEWWKRNPTHKTAPENSKNNLTIVLRDVAEADASALLKVAPVEEDSPAWLEGVLEKYFGTHHQKPVLIDYDHEEGSKAVGYIMGLNSITDFWDTYHHECDSSKREVWKKALSDNEKGHESATDDSAHTESKTAQYGHAKPYRDYACRMTGPVLAQLHFNFENAWNAVHGKALMESPPAPPARIKESTKVCVNPDYHVQVVRTQAHEQDKSIKELYFQAASAARNYIYIENQYFFYPEFARHLKQMREKYCEGWQKCRPLNEMPMLHLFIVIPHPEDDGMVPRTADTLTELGHSNAMPAQQKLGDDAALRQKYPDSRPVEATVGTDETGREIKQKGYVLDRPSVAKLQKTLGLNVSVARLRTTGPEVKAGERAYREIYIHSKLMLIDEVFVTLGSANLNQRSMSIDSEINVGALGPAWAKDLRSRIFTNLTAGNVEWGGDFKELPNTFKNWEDLMGKNKTLRYKGLPMQGFLLPFEDHRATTTMHG